MSPNRLCRLWTCGLLLAGAAAVFAGRTEAIPPFLNAWKDRYPTSTIPQRMAVLFGEECFTCHLPPEYATEATCYRLDILDRLNAGMTIAQAIDAVHALDSDGDGTPNGVEITKVRADNPLHRGYHPGLTGPVGLSPCGPTPTQPVTNQPETPPCYPDCNADGALTVADFGCFQTRFVQGDPYTDCNGDGVRTVADFGCFQTGFVLGCP